MTSFLIFILVAYLIGAIPTAIWYGRIFHKTDIRQHGSGNAGATNTVRTFGKKAGIIVLFIDIAKGSLGVLLPNLVQLVNHEYTLLVDGIQYPALILGLSAALGHIYPIYEKFKGGKGVATLFGVIIAIHPLVALITMGCLFIMFMLTRRVSIGSIISSICFALAFILLNRDMLLLDYVFIWIYPALIMYTHRSNIKRILNGTEPKLSLGKK